MTRIKVALLTLGSPDRMTGGHLFHRRLAERSARHGAQVGFVSVPDLPLPWAMACGPAWLRDRALRRADIIVLDSIAAAATAPWLGRIGKPIVGMLHQPLGGMEGNWRMRGIRLSFDRWAYRRADLLLVASEWLAHQLPADGISRSRLTILPPGKDPQSDGAAARSLGADLKNGRVIGALCVANWLPRKGILELLEAIAALPGQSVTLHLVGDTTADRAYARRVNARLRQPDLRRRVMVHGPVPAGVVERMYRSADVFVLPSFVEPYGTVWGEAMAAGLPVIGWRAGNLPFLADDDREALLVPVGDVDALARAIERLASDAELRARLGGAGARRAAERPTWDETAERFFTELHAAVDGRRHQRR